VARVQYGFLNPALCCHLDFLNEKSTYNNFRGKAEVLYNAEVFPLVSWQTVRAKLPLMTHSEVTAYFVVGVLGVVLCRGWNRSVVGDAGYNYTA